MPVCQLEDFAVTRLRIDFRLPSTGDTVEVESVTSRFDYETFVNRAEKNRYRLSFGAKFTGKDSNDVDLGYDIESRIEGIFAFPLETEREEREKLIRVNGVSILYGILRGIIANATGVFPGGKFTIPAIMPQDIVKAVEHQKAAASDPKRANGLPKKREQKSRRRKPAIPRASRS